MSEMELLPGIVEQARQHVASFEAIGGTVAYPFSVRLARYVVLQHEELERLRRSPPQGVALMSSADLGCYDDEWTLDLHYMHWVLEALVDRTALSSPPAEEGEWRSIDTAPKDAVILVADEDGDVHKVSWGDCCPGYPNSPRMRWCVAWTDGEHGYHIVEHPTHWQPLPSPPGLSPSPSVEGESRSDHMIRKLCNAAPESPGCIWPKCDCGTGSREERSQADLGGRRK